MEYTPPKYREKAFNCPYCSTYSLHVWIDLYYRSESLAPSGAVYSQCAACAKLALWLEKSLVYPLVAEAPMSHPDLPEHCFAVYEEARSVFGMSKRASAALIRLALEHLVRGLCPDGKDINDCIKQLVTKGLPVQIQQAMDVCRVIGNEAVHPGTIDVNESPEVAYQLFELVNFIVENQITQPRKIAELFDGLPESKKEGIRKRDGK